MNALVGISIMLRVLPKRIHSHVLVCQLSAESDTKHEEMQEDKTGSKQKRKRVGGRYNLGKEINKCADFNT